MLTICIFAVERKTISMDNKVDYNAMYDAVRILTEGKIAVRQGYKWGLIDSTNKELMPIIYDYISYNDGRLWARYKGDKFYISLEWLPLKYDCIYTFGEKGLAKAIKNGKVGAIDKLFNEVIPCQYDDFNEEGKFIRAGIKTDDNSSYDQIKYDVYTSEGALVLRGVYFPSFSNIVMKKVNGNHKYGIIDDDYNIVIPCENKSIQIVDFPQYKDYYDIQQNGGYHFLWIKGKGLVNIGYDMIEKSSFKLHNLLMCHRKQLYPNYNSRANHLMRNTTIGIKPYGYPFNEEYVDVYSNDKKLLSYCPAHVELIKHIEDDLFICKDKASGMFGLVCDAGYKAPNIYDSITYENKLNAIVAIRGAKYDLVEYNASFDYSTGEPIVKTKNVLKDGVVDLFDRRGIIIRQGIDWKSFDMKASFSYANYLKIRIGKGDAVFKDMKQIIRENTFDEIGEFVSRDWRTGKDIELGYTIVRRNGKLGAVNSEGNLIIPLKYNQIKLLILNYSQAIRILYAHNEISEAFYKADKSLKKLEYSYVLAEPTADDLFIVSKDEIPMELNSLEKLEFYELWGDKIDSTQLVEVKDEKTGKVNLERNPELPPTHQHLFGKIDLLGNEIIPCEFPIKEIKNKTVPKKTEMEYITVREYEDCKIVRENCRFSKVGIVDNDGNTICDVIYESISDFNVTGTAFASLGEGKTGIINKKGELLLPCSYSFYLYKTNCVYKQINTTYYVVSDSNKFGIVDSFGTFIVPCVYPELSFENEFNKYRLVKVNDHGKKGLISLTNNNEYVLDCAFDSIELLYRYPLNEENYIIAKRDNYCKVISLPTMDVLFEDDSKESIGVVVIHDDIIVTSHKFNGNTFYSIYSISKKNYLEEVCYEKIGSCGAHHIQVCKNNRWGLFNTSTCVEDIPCDYYEDNNDNMFHPSASFMFSSNDGYAVVKKDGFYGYINHKNQIIIPCTYCYAESFFDGLAVVKTSGKTGCHYHSYNNNRFSFTTNVELPEGTWGFINKEGKLIADGYEDVYGFKEGLAAVKKNDKWGFIDKQGKIAIPLRFTKAKSFSDGLAAVAFKIRYGYIDKHNKTIIPFKYIDAYDFHEGLASVYTSNDGYGEISKDGIVVEWTNRELNDPYLEDDNTDYMRYTWDAMTDGMYGDMPEGFDGDFDFLGY